MKIIYSVLNIIFFKKINMVKVKGESTEQHHSHRFIQVQEREMSTVVTERETEENGAKWTQ